MAGPQVKVWYKRVLAFLNVSSRTLCCRLLPDPLSFVETVSWSVGQLARRQVPSYFMPWYIGHVGWLLWPVRPGEGSPCCDGYLVGCDGFTPVYLSLHLYVWR